MGNFVLAAIRQYKITLFLTFCTAVFGLYSYYFLPKQENPDLTIPEAMVVTYNIGASPENIEQQITKPIEIAVSDITGFKKCESWSTNSMSIVVVSVKNDADVDKAWLELRRKLNDLEGKLPKEAEKPIVDTRLTETAGMIISLSGEKYTYDELGNFAKTIRKELSGVEGISRFDIVGKVERYVNIKVDNQKLYAINLSMEEIAECIKVRNLEIPLGEVKNAENTITLYAPALYKDINEIENTVIKVSDQGDGVVRLKDIASIALEDAEDINHRIRHNGMNSVLLAGYFKPSMNIILIGNEVRERLNRIKEALPKDLLLDEVSFEPETIAISISNFMMNLIQGVVLVMVVVFLGLGFRNALVVSTAIPLSIVITFGVMYMIGIKVHQVSTAALIIALGMLVDNAIVIVEATQVRIDAGEKPMKAAYDAAVSNATPIFTSSLTTIVAFLPLLSIPGASGEFLVSIPQLIIISLTASYFVAMIVIPAMAAIFFRTTNKKKIPKDRLKDFFAVLLERGLRHSWKAVGISVGLLFIVILIFDALPQQFFPYADTEMMYIDISGYSPGFKQTDNLVQEVEKIIQNKPCIANYTVSIGDDLPRFYLTLPVNVPSPNYAQMMIKINPEEAGHYKSKRDIAIYLQQKIDSAIYNGEISVKMLESTDPKSGQIVVRLAGEEQERINEIARTLQEKMKLIQGTYNVQTDLEDKTFRFGINMDFNLISVLGITNYDVQRQINLATKGEKISKYSKKGSSFDIYLKSNIASKEELEKLYIKASLTGERHLLKHFAIIKPEAMQMLLKRYQKEKTAMVYCDALSGYSSSDIEDYIEHHVLPELNLAGVTVSFHGEREEISRDFGKLGIAGVFAVFMVFIILLLQFKSFVQPLIILITIPLGFIGAISGLFLFNAPLSFSAMLGIASLIGIVVNNAILLITFINDARADGMRIKEACIDAANKRYKPIMLTTITTVSGLIPLALTGSELFGPLAISLMSGLVLSTFLTLVIIPVLYSMIEVEK